MFEDVKHSCQDENVSLTCHLLQCMEEAGVDGALIVQPINHKFDHSLVTRSDIFAFKII